MAAWSNANVRLEVWNSSDPDADSTFSSVIQLHRESSSTLGLLTFAAFEEAGRRQRLVLGLVDGVVQGYVLYSTPRHHTIRLVHVCVGRSARKIGLAKSMVEFVIAQNPDRTTITAHCRADYGLDHFWRSLDMTPETERAGRAAAGSKLTIWTRRIGQLDLLEDALYASARPLAVLDSNVLMDMYLSDAVDRHDRQESLGLVQDWVAGLLELTFSPEAHVDVNSYPSVEERMRVHGRMTAHVPVRRDSGMKQVAEAIVARMPQRLLSKDESLPNDAIHLADAVLAGADYFVTRDENLIAATGDWIQAEHSIQVVRPAELLQSLIPATAFTQFRSDLLESVGLTWGRVNSSDSSIEESFLAHGVNEKAKFFRKRMQAVLARPTTAQLEMLVDGRGRRWALLGTEVAGDQLLVSVLRVGRGQLGSTIGFQLVRHLRELALARGAASINVTDDAVDSVVRAALEADGFEATSLSATIAKYPDDALIEGVVSATDVAAFERKNWPQVLLDRQVPAWIIPIQPTYARSLIGYNDTLLMGRDKPALGLAREFVYFASPKIKSWDVPARALWYVTKDKDAKEPTAVRAVVGFSRIVASAVLDVDEAIEQYRAIGVLRAYDIRDRSRNGKVLVLRFEDTHMLQVPVGKTTFEQILRRHGVKPPIQTTRSAPNGLFDDLLRTQPEFDQR